MVLDIFVSSDFFHHKVFLHSGMRTFIEVKHLNTSSTAANYKLVASGTSSSEQVILSPATSVIDTPQTLAPL